MREIIFRGKCQTGEWVFGGFLNRNGKPEIVDWDRAEEGDFTFTTPVDPSTVGQYTGLDPTLVQDKKLVFDGDIVKITDHTIEETFERCGALVTMLMTRTYEVFWNKTKWSIRSLEPMLAIDPPIFDLPTKNVTYEIVGNIHDQKEDI